MSRKFYHFASEKMGYLRIMKIDDSLFYPQDCSGFLLSILIGEKTCTSLEKAIERIKKFAPDAVQIDDLLDYPLYIDKVKMIADLSKAYLDKPEKISARQIKAGTFLCKNAAKLFKFMGYKVQDNILLDK